MRLLSIVIFINLVIWCAGHHATASDLPKTFIVPKSSSGDINHEDYYFSNLLRLALDKTRGSHGDYQLREYPVFVADDRLRQELKLGKLDVIRSVTHPDYECELLPVRIPLLEGLNDYRVLLIRDGEQNRFARVKSLDDLRKFTGGLSSQWSDVVVMQANNLPLVTAPGYETLFRMLAAGRFDYFSRGLYQAKTEVNLYPDLNLAIEPGLMLHYPSKFYFFVKRNDKALAERLRHGLEKARMDGSFDALFRSIPRHRWGLRELKAGKRRVIELQPPESAKRPPCQPESPSSPQ